MVENSNKINVGYIGNVANIFIENKFISIAIIYFIFSVLMKILFKIDILIPCLWKTVFNIKCFGCGLTSAFIELIQFNFLNAYDANMLIFIVVPGILYFIISSVIGLIYKK